MSEVNAAMHDQAASLGEYRRRIDALDAALVQTLSERLRVCADVARFKKAHGIPMMQPQRVEEVKERAAAAGAAAGLSRPFVHALYGLIIAEACRLEDELIGAVER